MMTLPYQFGLATISGFGEHTHITGSQTNQNQLVNIYYIDRNSQSQFLSEQILKYLGTLGIQILLVTNARTQEDRKNSSGPKPKPTSQVVYYISLNHSQPH